MIIEYEMRTVNTFGRFTEWVNMCGSFDSWETFNRFKYRESLYHRQVRNAVHVVK